MEAMPCLGRSWDPSGRWLKSCREAIIGMPDQPISINGTVDQVGVENGNRLVEVSQWLRDTSVG